MVSTVTQVETTQADLVILAAHPLELASFAASLGTGLRGTIAGLRIVARSVGVGLAEAGSGSARVLSEERPRAVLLVGSCGLYPGAEPFTPGKLLIPNRITGLDGAVLSGKAAFPDPMLITLEPDAALSDALAAATEPILRGPLGVTLAITTNDTLASELARASDCCAENLEALAVGLACRALGLPFAALLACTNEVGSRGRAQWAQHHTLAATTTATHVVSWLKQGAPGLR
jgi:nucleoside phosphorylase